MVFTGWIFYGLGGVAVMALALEPLNVGSAHLGQLLLQCFMLIVFALVAIAVLLTNAENDPTLSGAYVQLMARRRVDGLLGGHGEQVDALAAPPTGLLNADSTATPAFLESARSSKGRAG